MIEALLAIFIAVILLTAVNATFYRSQQVMQTVRQQGEVYQMGRMALDRMIRDITCTYLPVSFTSGDGPTEDEIAAYRFIGKREKDGTTDKDAIYFTTTSDLGLGGHRGLVGEVDYYLKEVEQGQGVYYLIRREDVLPHLDITKRGTEMELAEDVVGLAIVYLDKDGNESEDWDLAARRSLPDQVRITLTFKRGDETYPFTAVASPTLADMQIKKKAGKSPS